MKEDEASDKGVERGILSQHVHLTVLDQHGASRRRWHHQPGLCRASIQRLVEAINLNIKDHENPQALLAKG